MDGEDALVVRAREPALGQVAAQVPWVPAVNEAFSVLHGGCAAANELFSPAIATTASVNQLVNQSAKQSINQTVNESSESGIVSHL